MANHRKPIVLVKDEPEQATGPLMQWVTLFRGGDNDYRVATLFTQGLPEDAEVGEQSIDVGEAEERFRIAAADTLDLGTEVNVTLPSKAAPPRVNEAQVHNLAIDSAIAALQRLRRPA